MRLGARSAAWEMSSGKREKRGDDGGEVVLLRMEEEVRVEKNTAWLPYLRGGSLEFKYKPPLGRKWEATKHF